MSMNDRIVRDGLAMFHALAALKIKRGARIIGTREGMEIHQPGKPVLLLTRGAAEDYAKEMGAADYE
ncbi:MAG: hypothetical protein Q8R82_06700 [Hyphomonadaceae bacterium]|nr:hypothetical protein [Hyphomonadaceae bacterium]